MVDRMFDKIDTDGSGDISIDELREDMRRRFPNISEEQIQQLFDLYVSIVEESRA